MNQDINLLHSKTVSAKLSQKKVTILRIIAFGILFTISFFSITLFILIALSPLPKLQEQEKEEITNLSSYYGKMTNILFTKERLGHINTILSKRITYGDTLQNIFSGIPADIVVDTMSVEENKISLSVSSGSLQSIESFLQRLVTLNEDKKMINKVTLSHVRLNPQNATYVVDVEFIKL